MSIGYTKERWIALMCRSPLTANRTPSIITNDPNVWKTTKATANGIIFFLLKQILYGADVIESNWSFRCLCAHVGWVLGECVRVFFFSRYEYF